MARSDQEITRILGEFKQNDRAAEELLELVYGQLRAIAQARMNREDVGHSLQATALVHEAFFKILGPDSQDWEDRGHFFRAAANAMRRILIDHARKKKSEKRGGLGNRLPINVLDLAADYNPDSVLALDDALQALEAEDPEAAEVVRLRFFGGLSVQETAQTLKISERSVAREWAFARARLFSMLTADE